ncbi:MAG: tannase/feruloyl esterase family alpha/beta hydrolase [Betaproteobacteria bacterium]|nr:tannase/feruloyl esterase family alpha/beta hydrolase [Betaproteobacteria bacterium]NBZ99661.1 tannase/feruloyl esterase family alpha/beta hydrolase [Betaproteobacteria bacterium]NDB43539.1 tannase/feruloyl esterase family alpha/beta hydrolase [Betaproteobacteria bacterium]NDD01790.1 tannase/feruloyl esterase family alpha/beta hydrolase [Betaproteobacteria bacterium]NDE24573.1 tannase/feruloyl esterase family alpha/beta hydrolase [Betaproteobacteria bacterium]
MHMTCNSKSKLAAAIASMSALLLVGCGGDSSLPQLSEATPSSFSGDCATLAASITGLKGTVITGSSTVAAGLLSNISTPEHCLVTGKMNERVSPVDGATYYIGFQVRLPKNWNGRFYYQANGGTDGAVSNAVGALGGGPVTSALAKGFAVLSSDAGHQSQTTPFFGIDPQARIDYGYNAVAQLTPMAKDLIKSVYGKAPDRSYLGGCSNGGRHALVAASRYGDQYDGILGGAPGYNLPKAAVAQLWGVQQYATIATATKATDTTASGTVVTLPTPLPDVSTAFTPTERAMIASKILSKCDALDGATDNWVGDVAACQKVFSVANDIPTCTGARDGSCLTGSQKTVLTNVHDGAKNSTGTALYNSFPYDVGISSSGWASWKFSNSTGVGRDPGATAFIFTTPPQTDTVSFLGLPYAMKFNFDTDAPKIFATSGIYTESAMSFMTPQSPSNLSKLRDRGAKMIVYHGTSDPVFSFNDTVSWLDSVKAVFGGLTDSFVKLYPVPAMSHCSGGPAADQFDLLDPLVNWVEKGVTPGSVVAKARGVGTSSIPALINAEVPNTWAADRTRPLCPYPTVATYNGSGDHNTAASFSCK